MEMGVIGATLAYSAKKSLAVDGEEGILYLVVASVLQAGREAERFFCCNMEVLVGEKGVSVGDIGVILGETRLHGADGRQLCKVALECMRGDVAEGGCSGGGVGVDKVLRRC